ncbi:hypothetical protein NBRC10512_000291 [Rhodotorula toruloides]|uniref:RHTO0S11e00870g1_1 n=2 Tax=Rhodotorula toruloides TaxID=5286 RepID=A0A061B7X7_RHOTO|nr:phosphoribosylglycinamide synthetase [Rhodotorula toruloides NP11]EMS19998.1 phosphoribosylglycinamide synthetase [Rhodotorula toruloides NP11]CDR45496.1 RHTO0S11e00870g1_1 [Rhodotorula toruloides]
MESNQGWRDRLPFSLTSKLALSLFDNAGPRLAHPCVRACDVSSALRDANGDIDLLAPQLAVLALCAMAMGSLLSIDPAILANHAGNVQTLADVESLGPDLRTLGQSRSNAYLALKSEAKRRARALGVDVDPSFANAASCWLLDYLEAVEATDRHTPRPWHAAYLSHIRRLRWTQPLNSASWSDDTIWAFNLGTDNLANLGEVCLSSRDVALLVKLVAQDPVALEASLRAGLDQPLNTGVWPDAATPVKLGLDTAARVHEEITGLHARQASLDESALLRAFTDIEQLSTIASLFLALTDRLLDDDRTSESSMMRRVPFSRRQALRHIRFFVAVQWTSPALALYRELQRRVSLAVGLGGEATTFQRFEQQRLHLHLSQSREYAFSALDSILAALDRTPHITFWTHLQPRLIHQWAEFLVEEVEAGRAGGLGERLGGICQTLAGALLKVGFCFTNPSSDALIARLENIAAAEHLATTSFRHADPLSLFAFLSNTGSPQDGGPGSSGSSTGAAQTTMDPNAMLGAGVWQPESWWPSIAVEAMQT